MTAAATSPRGSTEDLFRPIAKSWWLWVLFGVLAIGAGVLALIFPDLSLLAVAILFIALGIVILALPDIGLITLALLFGISLVVRGVAAIASGIRLRRMAPA
jgi:uncharacterized membrane protein HdeD (DUF308 family)